jgi:hypothetical protein
MLVVDSSWLVGYSPRDTGKNGPNLGELSGDLYMCRGDGHQQGLHQLFQGTVSVNRPSVACPVAVPDYNRA